jgi:hypothetical protein
VRVADEPVAAAEFAVGETPVPPQAARHPAAATIERKRVGFLALNR